DRPGATDAHKLPFLQHPQKFGLQNERQLSNFIKKNRSAFSHFQKTLFLSNGAGESAFFVAEEFTFQQRLGDGRAIEGNVRLILSQAVLVDGGGRQFLAGSTLAVNQNGGIGRSDPLDELIDLAHAGTVANHAVSESSRGAEALIFVSEKFELASVLKSNHREGGDGSK